jgi:hypothetical protein
MEQLFVENPILVVLAVALILWAGVSIYLFIIDKKLKKAEKQAANLTFGDKETM